MNIGHNTVDCGLDAVVWVTVTTAL